MITYAISELKSTFKNPPLEEILLLHVTAAIALHPRIRESKAIETLYEENKTYYYDFYRKSSYYHHVFFLNMPAVDSVLVQKCMAVYLGEEAKGNGDSFLRKFIQIGFKKISNYVEHNEVVSITSLVSMYVDKRTPDISDMQLNYIGAILLYLGLENKQIVSDKMLKNTLYNLGVFTSESRVKDEAFQRIREERSLQMMQRLQTSFGFKLPKEDTLDSLLGLHERDIFKNALTTEEKKKFSRNMDFDIIYSKKLLRYWKTLTAILRLNHINEMNFDIIPINREDLLDIGTLFTIFEEEKGRLKPEEHDMFLVSCLTILMMGKHYNRLRNSYQTLFEENSGLSKILEAEKEQSELEALREKEKQSSITIAQQNERIGRLELELIEMKKQLKESNHNESEYNSLKKEVVSLREYVFSTDEPLEESPEITQNNIDILKDKKIVVFGGHPKWQQRVKEILPNVRTVEAETLHIDLSFLANMDIVCFVPTYNNHSQYERVMNALDKSEAALLYVNQTNIDAFIHDLTRTTAMQK